MRECLTLKWNVVVGQCTQTYTVHLTEFHFSDRESVEEEGNIAATVIELAFESYKARKPYSNIV